MAAAPLAPLAIGAEVAADAAAAAAAEGAGAAAAGAGEAAAAGAGEAGANAVDSAGGIMNQAFDKAPGYAVRHEMVDEGQNIGDTTAEQAGATLEGMTAQTFKDATYGDQLETPDSISRRIEDPVNGGIDPHQRSDESNDDWGYDMLDVNEIGQSKDNRGDDLDKARRKRLFASEKEVSTTGSEALDKFFGVLPLIMEYFNSEESALDDPIVKSVHDALESEFPGYLDSSTPHEENEILLLLGDNPERNSRVKKSDLFGPPTMVNQAPVQPMSLGQETPATQDDCHNCGAVLDPSDKICPKCSAPSTAGNEAEAGTNPAWPYGTIQNLVQPNMSQPKRTASDQQGPHTDEQQAAVAELLVEQGREDEIPNMIENSYKYDEELAEVQNKNPMLGEDPQDLPTPPAEQPMPNQGMPPGLPPMGAPEPMNAPPPGAPQMMSSVRNSMIDSVIKYATDNVAAKCPKCDGHTTGIVDQEGTCSCKTCGHSWSDKTFQKSDGTSTDTSTTSNVHVADQFDQDTDFKEEVHSVEPSSIDSFSEPEEELEVDDSSHTWKDENGEPLEEGQEYEIYAHDYEIPDVGRLNEVKPDALVYTIESNGGLNTTIEIDRKEADMNGYRFVPANGPSSENPAGIEENLDGKPLPEAGNETTDLSTPHIQIGSSTKMSYEELIQEARNWLLELDGPAVFREFEDLDWEDYAYEINALSPDQLHQAIESHYGGGWDDFVQNVQPQGPNQTFAKTAGQHYTPMEQRELIDEYGQARNADKLALEGTHYVESSLDDSFLFGC